MSFVLVLTSLSTEACPACSVWPALSFTLTCFSCNCSFPSDQVPVAILVCFAYCCMVLLRFCDCTGMKQKEKFCLGEIAEALGCANPMCGVGEYQHWVTGDGAQVWFWRPQSYQKLTSVRWRNAHLRLDKTNPRAASRIKTPVFRIFIRLCSVLSKFESDVEFRSLQKDAKVQ